jgi:hypothetical protein
LSKNKDCRKIFAEVLKKAASPVLAVTNIAGFGRRSVAVACRTNILGNGRVVPATQTFSSHHRGDTIMGSGKGALLWLLGIPMPIILLLALFWRQGGCTPRQKGPRFSGGLCFWAFELPLSASCFSQRCNRRCTRAQAAFTERTMF